MLSQLSCAGELLLSFGAVENKKSIYAWKKRRCTAAGVFSENMRYNALFSLQNCSASSTGSKQRIGSISQFKKTLRRDSANDLEHRNNAALFR